MEVKCWQFGWSRAPGGRGRHAGDAHVGVGRDGAKRITRRATVIARLSYAFQFIRYWPLRRSRWRGRWRRWRKDAGRGYKALVWRIYR